jgi:hypothetical protein
MKISELFIEYLVMFKFLDFNKSSIFDEICYQQKYYNIIMKQFLFSKNDNLHYFSECKMFLNEKALQDKS